MAALHEASLDTVTAGRRPVPGAAFIEVDLLRETDLLGVVRRSGASHMIHLAWEAGHGAYWSHPDNTDWAIATARLVDAFCRAGGKGIVVAGTCAEYDWSQGWCRENATPSDPATLYGSAKDAARRLSCDIARLSGVRLAWGRLFLSHGADEDPRRLVPSVLAALRGEHPAFSIDADALRDLLHVRDTGAALVKLLTGGADGIANVCSGVPVSLREIVTVLAGLTGTDPAPMLSLSAARPGEPRLLSGEPARLKSLGWAPRLTLAQGLELHAKDRA
jgi:nucleoside-diphosphate-sugar epimerase